MKKIFSAILLLTIALTSCSKEDEPAFDSSVTTTPQNYISKITHISESVNSDNVIERDSTYYYFTYDSKNRLKNISTLDREDLASGGSIVYTESVSYTYGDSDISVYSLWEEVETDYDYIDEVLTQIVTSSIGAEVFDVELNSDNTLASVTDIYSSYNSSYNSIENISYEYINGLVSSYTRSLNDEVKGAGVIGWEDDNMRIVGVDQFKYSTMLNDYNIDLNMFITHSEDLDDILYGSYIGLLNEINGIHSANLVSSCDEEGCDYEIIYTKDSNDRVTQAKFDKYGNGNYYIINVEYY